MKVTVMAMVICLLPCWLAAEANEETITITLAETGDIILSDQHISLYVLDGHRLVLTKEGVERWESFVQRDSSHVPPIPKIGGLNGKEFVLAIGDAEIYRGYFWSMAMSLMKTGVKIYDTLGAPYGELWIGFDQLYETTVSDPRNSPEITKYFEERDRLEQTRELPSN
jgi:hypothetical protein